MASTPRYTPGPDPLVITAVDTEHEGARVKVYGWDWAGRSHWTMDAQVTGRTLDTDEAASLVVTDP